MAGDDRPRRTLPLDTRRRSVLEARMTAGEVVERIRKNIDVPWREATYRDTFKAGGPATPVIGIATTAFAGFDVVRRAVAEGLNMIVPHEVTFWTDRDEITIVNGDTHSRQNPDFMTK